MVGRNLGVSLILLVCFGLVGLGWLIDEVYQTYLATDPAHQEQPMSAEQQMLRGLLTNLGQSEQLPRLLSQWSSEQGLELQMVPLAQVALPDTLLIALQAGELLELASQQRIQYYHYVLDAQQILIMSAPLAVEQHEGLEQTRLWLTVLFYSLLVGLLAMWLVPLIRRLTLLRQTASRFGQGDLTARIMLSRHSSIRDLESEFNRMAQRIEDLVADVKLLSSAVSHDLRTPLAKLQLGLDVLSEEQDPEKREEYSARLNHQLEHMTELVNALLSYARLDQDLLQLEWQPVDLVQLCRTMSTRYAAEVSLTCEYAHDSLQVNGDPAYVKIAITNLLDNAVRYARGSVLLTVALQGQQVLLTIEDNGPGIPPDQREHLLKPFIRGKHTDANGFGLGLSMVKRIVEWHRGTLVIGDSPRLGGAHFTLTLPRLAD